MHLTILNYQKTIFENTIQNISIKSDFCNSLSILKDHAPLVQIIKDARLSYLHKNQKHTMKIKEGMLEVKDNKIIVLVEKIN